MTLKRPPLKNLLDKPTDLYSFGNTKAAVNLASILNEFNNTKYVTRVSQYLNSGNLLIKAVVSIENHDMRAIVLELLAKELNRRDINVPPILISHSKNVLKTRIKMEMRNIGLWKKEKIC